jgi:signal transduction histidine kinase
MAEPRWPLTLALAGSAAYIAVVATGVANPAGDGVGDVVLFLVSFLGTAALSVILGLVPRRRDGVAGVLVLTVAAEWGSLNPFPVVVIVGLWLVGLVVRSHRDLDRALRVRAYELSIGRELYVAEALRYERSRIARELHDIIAHSLSVIVIQASAGQRLPAGDPSAPELLANIREMTGEVRENLHGLAGLLDAAASHSPALTRESLDHLLQQVVATGSPLTSTLPDDFDEIPGAVGAVVYRVLQEGLTNAIKHAPGAAIDVTVASAPAVDIAIVNQASRGPFPIRPVPGAGRGLVGLTERVVAAGGTFASGPTTQGGWQLRARLPLTVAAVQGSG